MTTFLAILFLLLCIVMIGTILIQRPKGGGIGGAFGGGGGGGSQNALMGAKVGDFLTWLTVIMFVCFLGLGMGLVWSTRAAHNATVDTKKTEATSTDAGDGTKTPADGGATPANPAAPAGDSKPASTPGDSTPSSSN
ncbi:MAG: preprotein translocase subunit SecG [Phycisphaera sp.]|nr:preprotein translocase subunit SecG [Phycisphaera sp.]